MVYNQKLKETNNLKIMIKLLLSITAKHENHYSIVNIERRNTNKEHFDIATATTNVSNKIIKKLNLKKKTDLEKLHCK